MQPRIELESRVLQFGVNIDRILMVARENLHTTCHLNKYPHPSNLIVSGQYKPMELAREFQSVFIPVQDDQTYLGWLTKEFAQIDSSQTLFYFGDQSMIDVILGQLDQRRHEEILKRVRVIAPEPTTIVSGTDNHRVDIRRVVYVPSTTNSFLDLTQVYMNCLDDDDLGKTDMEFVIILR